MDKFIRKSKNKINRETYTTKKIINVVVKKIAAATIEKHFKKRDKILYKRKREHYKDGDVI